VLPTNQVPPTKPSRIYISVTQSFATLFVSR